MTRFYVTILFICFALISNAQEPGFEWVKAVNSDSENTSFSVVRSIASDNDGNVYSTGYFWGTTDFDPGPGEFLLTSEGGSDIFILKLDSDGNFVWAKSYGSSLADEGTAIGIVSNLNDAHLFVAGFFNETVLNQTSYGGTDMFLYKFDLDGEFVWRGKFGGPGDDKVTTMYAKSNLFILGGIFEETARFDPVDELETLTSEGDDDIAIIRLQSSSENGIQVLSARQIGGAGKDNLRAINLGAGRAQFSGTFEGQMNVNPGMFTGPDILSSPGATSAFSINVPLNFSDVNWARSYSVPEEDSENDNVIDNSGNVYSVGTFYDSMGYANIGASLGENDSYIMKHDIAGDLVWAKKLGGIGFNSLQEIEIDANGNLFILGSFTESQTITYLDGTSETFTTGSNFSAFMASLDTDGNYLWAEQFHSSNLTTGNQIHIRDNNIYISGGFKFLADDCDPTSGVASLSSNSIIRDFYIEKLTASTSVGVSEADLEIGFKAYPNPTSGLFTIDFETVLTEVNISILDVQGRLISSSEYENTNRVDLEINGAAGVYFVKINTSEGQKTVYFIKK